jgi:hypothetical protein
MPPHRILKCILWASVPVDKESALSFQSPTKIMTYNLTTKGTFSLLFTSVSGYVKNSVGVLLLLFFRDVFTLDAFEVVVPVHHIRVVPERWQTARERTVGAREGIPPVRELHGVALKMTVVASRAESVQVGVSCDKGETESQCERLSGVVVLLYREVGRGEKEKK